jgi:3-deoxy-manno-octulosonate cytidylyltransferase (CMP-KDO synthetase)
MRIVAVIPARLASTRLPRKMLREIGGKPLAVRVYEAVRSSPLLDVVIIATDSEEIRAACEKHSCKVQMTSEKHRSGTERVHEVSRSVHADVYINVQGDEPMICASHIEVLIGLMKNPEVPVGTLKTPAAAEDIANPNAVKVVTDGQRRALYFSRSAIPHDRDGSHPRYFKHLGIYAYRKQWLERFVALPESSLERAERLEQLRLLENGIPIYVAETPYDSIGVDTAEDLERVTKKLEP